MIIDALPRGAFRRPALTLLLTVAAAALGALALVHLPRDVFPDLSTPVFNVIVQNPALSAEELETGLAIPLEAALGGLPGARRVRSTSQLGVCQVTVEFEPDSDWFRSRQLVAEHLAQLAGELPPGTGAPFISSLSGRLNEILELTLSAPPGTADLMTLRDLADFEVRNRLLAVPGVGSVERLGGWVREFQVLLDPLRMAARGVTLDEVLAAAREAGENAAAGVVARGDVEWTLRVIGRPSDVADLREVVVAGSGATPVLLGDVADVVEGPAVRRGLAHRLDGEVVSLRVVKQFGADTVSVARGTREAVTELQRSLPAGAQLDVVYDQSTLVEAALGGVGRAILLGAGFVVLVLVTLLGNLRAALVVVMTLPLSVGLAGLVLERTGVGLNTMTLGGLAIAVGLLVDAAIIVVENVVHRLQSAPADRGPTILAATLEVGRPIAFATLVVIAVFAPLFSLSGLEGRMYRPLALAVIAAVGCSLLLALTLVPVATGLILRRARLAGEGRVLRAVKRVYAPLLDWCLAHSRIVLLATLGVTVPALWLATRIGADLMPELDEGAVLVQTLLPGEASLDEVDRLNHRVEDALRAVPEVLDVVRRTGRGEVTEDPMPHTLSDVLVVLRPDRDRSADEVAEDVREALQDVPGVVTLITTPLGMRIDEGLGGTPADLQVKIFGPELAQLSELGDRARELLADMPGLADLRVESLDELPQIRLDVDRLAAARLGLTPGSVVDAVRVAWAGEVAGEIWRGQRHHDLVVRLPDDKRRDVDALFVSGPDGTRAPLSQLANVVSSTGPSVVRREAGSRRIAVEASVTDGDLAGAADRVQAALDDGLSLPPGYFVRIGGRVETQEQAARALLVAVAVALLAVIVLLDLALGSMPDVLVILATLPAAFVGGIAALLLSGGTWNVSSLVGLIGLFGIAVQNGLVLITQTRGLLAQGLPFERAIREASLGRVRPKLMTAGAAILGLLPLLVLDLPGTEIERPLAVVIVGGLLTSTLFTLLALPTFASVVHAWRARRERPAGAADDSRAD